MMLQNLCLGIQCVPFVGADAGQVWAQTSPQAAANHRSTRACDGRFVSRRSNVSERGDKLEYRPLKRGSKREQCIDLCEKEFRGNALLFRGVSSEDFEET